MKPLREELEADLAQMDLGPDTWVRWWRATGERELRCILMTAWDPVGAGDVPEAWDEYDDYAPGIASRLRDAPEPSTAASEVAAYLNHIERDFMEVLTEERARANSYLAEVLVAWHEWSFEREGRSPQEWVADD